MVYVFLLRLLNKCLRPSTLTTGGAFRRQRWFPVSLRFLLFTLVSAKVITSGLGLPYLVCFLQSNVVFLLVRMIYTQHESHCACLMHKY